LSSTLAFPSSIPKTGAHAIREKCLDVAQILDRSPF
jgi:hypothetical protein